MLCLFYFAIITDKMCLFRFLDLKGRRTTYIILNIGLHYWKSCSRFNSCALSSAYLFICLFISNVDQKLARNRHCQRHSDLFLNDSLPLMLEICLWFLAHIMFLTWIYLASISSHWYILVCLPEELILSNACCLTAIYQLWS